MRQEPYAAFSTFFAQLKNQALDDDAAGLFLRAVGKLPPGAPSLPLLAGVADLCGGRRGANMIRERINRRYLRIRAVQDELGKLDFTKARPGAPFNDFVFDQIDFSAYRRLSAEEFTLFSGPGLDDFGDAFFKKVFRLSRAAVGALTASSYKRDGDRYGIKHEKLLANSLIMSIMRSLHTAVDFVPLITGEETLAECTRLLRFLTEDGGAPGAATALSKENFFYLAQGFNQFFPQLLKALDGAVVEHSDGMTTDLTAAVNGERLVLSGTFHPNGKAYTVTLASAAETPATG
ncbi:hypothetical protein FACS189483_08740 [Spirochaetia bacterium]|nr:hypothetical protein FACS189483_08740 [Spirochaetia bacterium]